MGVSGRKMLAALAAGTTDPDVLAEMARTRLRARLPELRKALNARFREHHGFLVAQILAHVDYLDEAVAQADERIAAALQPSEAAMTVLLSIAGIQRRTAEVVIAEIGTDMSRFPSSRHLASWAGLCPGNNESAGKRKHGRTTKGSPWPRTALVEAALGATRKNGYLQAKYRRVRSRRGISVPSSPSRTRSWRSFTRCCPAASSTPTSAPTSSSAGRPSRSPAARSASWSASATTSSSTTPSPSPPSRGTSGGFLSSRALSGSVWGSRGLRSGGHLRGAR